MRTELKTAFRPSLEQVEIRIVATAGVVAAAAIHHAPPHHPAHVAPHHASHHPRPEVQPEKTSVSPPSTIAPPPSNPPSPPSSSLPKDTTTDQAWVEIVNTTGQYLEYEIKIGPYANGQFIPFDIAPGATQFRMSSLISNGQRVKADFAIQFGNGPITPLNTGISQQSAQGYYIFMDNNLNYYVAPFVHS